MACPIEGLEWVMLSSGAGSSEAEACSTALLAGVALDAAEVTSLSVLKAAGMAPEAGFRYTQVRPLLAQLLQAFEPSPSHLCLPFAQAWQAWR